MIEPNTTEELTILGQLSEYCDCVEVKESDVNELIDLISMYTCWTKHPCETFLTSERKEVVDIPNCVCDCDVFVFEPYYRPFDADSFTFTLIEQDGITETATEITDYAYSVVDENFKIKLPLDKCGCRDRCGCPPNYKLLVTYVAGYDLLPECLLPVFCEALQWIKIKNTCDCSECQPCDVEQEEGVIDVTTLTGTLQEFFLGTLTFQYVKQLSLIGLCRPQTELWGVVV